MGSLNQLGGSLMFGISAICFGFVADALGPTHSLIITELLLAGILFLYYRVFKMERSA
jgi:hypothetical protein